MRVLRYPELRATKGIPFSKVHLKRLEDAGKFPRRFYLGENTAVWSEPEIDEYLESKAAGRVAATAASCKTASTTTGRGARTRRLNSSAATPNSRPPAPGRDGTAGLAPGAADPTGRPC